MQQLKDDLQRLFPGLKLDETSRSYNSKVLRGQLNGASLVAKFDPDKAIQECRATKLAQQVLGARGLRVPGVIGCTTNAVLLEYIEGMEPRLESSAHRALCIDFLTALQSIDPPSDLADHYFGSTLHNRLLEERVHLIKAKTLAPALAAIESDFESLLSLALKAEKFDNKGVLSHGDYQPKNLRITREEEVVPIDWVDFGRAHRAYDIGNLLYSATPEEFRSGIDIYLRESGNNMPSSMVSEFATQAAAISGVIRSGHYFRSIENGQLDQVDLAINSVLKGRKLLSPHL